MINDMIRTIIIVILTILLKLMDDSSVFLNLEVIPLPIYEESPIRTIKPIIYDNMVGLPCEGFIIC
ncbi:hypothetical protein GCM10025860_19390 [Methanobacterium ferruginis]|nr:hypothetical protein GCM10025860_19390 [Methanobacterium ferruginis]